MNSVEISITKGSLLTSILSVIGLGNHCGSQGVVGSKDGGTNIWWSGVLGMIIGDSGGPYN